MKSEKVAEKYHLEIEKPYKMGFNGTPDREMVKSSVKRNRYLSSPQ